MKFIMILGPLLLSILVLTTATFGSPTHNHNHLDYDSLGAVKVAAHPQAWPENGKADRLTGSSRSDEELLSIYAIVGSIIGAIILLILACYCCPCCRSDESGTGAVKYTSNEHRLPPATVSVIASRYQPRQHRASPPNFVPVWQPIPLPPRSTSNFFKTTTKFSSTQPSHASCRN